MSQIYFWNKTLHVSDSSSVHHQEFFTVHTAMVYVIQVCWQLVSKPVCPDDGQRNCPKHVEFYSKNKFETLAHLVGFIIRTTKELQTKRQEPERVNRWANSAMARKTLTCLQLPLCICNTVQVSLLYWHYILLCTDISLRKATYLWHMSGQIMTTDGL